MRVNTENKGERKLKIERKEFMLAGKKIAVLGVGKLGEALVAGLLADRGLKHNDVVGTVRHEKSRERAVQKLAIEVTTDNKGAIAGKDIVIIAVKPQNMDALLRDLATSLSIDQLVISCATSITTSYIEERLSKPIAVIRAMPNTPALLKAGMTALCSGRHASKKHVELAESIFKLVGESVLIDENLMDGVTALSASGPAYFYVVVESLAEAGVKLGMPRETSTQLVAQTMLGAAKMLLDSKSHPALLKDTVTTPAGCTIDGLMELEEGGLRVTLIKAVVKAAERARELVHDQDSNRK
jgi:pyrroline-5-carboxylate reductase